MNLSNNYYAVYNGNEPYLFISYSHDNEKQVLPIIYNLMKKGYRVWYDEGVQSTSKFLDNIADRLLNSACMIAFLSEDYYLSEYCKSELTFALENAVQVAIINLDGSTPPIGMRLQLAGQFSMNFQKYVDMEGFISKLTAPEIFKSCKEELKEDNQSDNRKKDDHSEDIEKKNSKLPLMIGGIVAIILLILSLGFHTNEPEPIVNDVQNTEALYTNLVSDFSAVSAENIKSITFLDTLANMPEIYWNASADWGNDVYSWACEDNGSFDVYYVAAGGVTAPENCKDLFKDYTALESVTFHHFDTSRVRDMSGMFMNCKNLSSVNVEAFDTSNVTDMTAMFYGCTKLENLNVKDWNVQNVSSFLKMFDHCESLKTLDLQGWNSIHATTMGSMFRYCYSLESLNLSEFKTTNVTDMSYMFADCSSLHSLDLSSFDTAKVTNLEGAFCKMTALKALDVSHFNVSRVKNMRSAFWYLNLHELDIREWETPCLEDVRFTFLDCPNLTAPDVSGWDFSNVTQYEKFMDEGVLINGEPWQTLFPS